VAPTADQFRTTWSRSGGDARWAGPSARRPG